MKFEEKNWLSDFSWQRILGFIVAAACLGGLIYGAQPPIEKRTEVATRVITTGLSKDVTKALQTRIAQFEKDGKRDASWQTATKQTKIKLVTDAAPRLKMIIADCLSTDHLVIVEQGEFATVNASVTGDSENVKVTLQLESAHLEKPKPIDASKRPGGWEAIVPPLLAILIALFFRRLVLALIAAVWAGAMVMSGSPLVAVYEGATKYVWGSIASSFNLYIITFTLGLVGMIQVVTRMGGIAGILERFKILAESARSARVSTALLGTAIFFDDYANTVVVGTSMRPITDSHNISREKLAYLVDSMSAPIAGVAIISTWIGYEVGLFQDLSDQLGLGRSGYDIFFSALPFRFYCLFTLGFVLLNAFTGRDYGPMLKAERRAASGEVLRAGAKPLTSAALSHAAPKPGIPYRARNAFLPVLTVIVCTMLGMYWSGWSDGDASIPAMFQPGLIEGWAKAAGGLTDWNVWRESFSGADGAKVLFFASMMGTIMAFGLAIGQKLLTVGETVSTYLKAIPAMRLAIVILILAWSIRAVCDDVGTSIYLVAVVQDLLSPEMLPIATFILAGAIAVATGTSWGTMGILLPAMIPLAFFMTEGHPNGDVLLTLCFAAVLDGAIFGDHCSPISDTTVMSSIASGCDHLDHVKTQLPYAMTTMVISGLFGYVGVAMGLPVWIGYIGAAVSIVAALFVLGRTSR